MSWSDAGFPYPFLVPLTAPAQALYDALVERIELTAAGRGGRVLLPFPRPELMGEDMDVSSGWGVYHVHHLTDIIDYYLLHEALPLYYDKETYDGDCNWTAEPKYWGYDGLGHYHVLMKRDGLVSRGLRSGEGLVGWHCDWLEGTQSPDDPTSYPSSIPPSMYTQYFAIWADQRRRFLALLKHRVLQIAIYVKTYSKTITMTQADADSATYKGIAMSAVQSPDSVSVSTGTRHGWYISPYTSGGTVTFTVQLHELHHISVSFVEGHALAGRECVLKHRATTVDSSQQFNSCGLPISEGWREWKFTTVQGAVSAGDTVQASGNDLVVNYDWSALDIPTPQKDAQGRHQRSSQGFTIADTFFASDISDTFTYHEETQNAD